MVGVPEEHSFQNRNYRYGYGYRSRRSLRVSSFGCRYQDIRRSYHGFSQFEQVLMSVGF